MLRLSARFVPTAPDLDLSGLSGTRQSPAGWYSASFRVCGRNWGDKDNALQPLVPLVELLT